MIALSKYAGFGMGEVLLMSLDEFGFWCGELERFLERENSAVEKEVNAQNGA